MSPVKSKELSAKSTGKKDKVVVEVGDADDLPPGWKKEVKFRKGSASSTKVDKFYTDPVTGYVFHSLKDVQRYLKTGIVGKLARKPKDNCRVDVVNEDGKSHMKEKEEMSETWRNKRPLDDVSEGYQIRSKSIENGKADSPHRASKQLAGINTDSPTPPSASTEPKTRRATRLTILKTDTPSPTTEPKTRRATRLAGIEIGSPPPSPPDTRSSRQAARKALVKISSSPSSPESKTQQSTEQSGIKIDELATSASQPKTRHAKRKLGMEINTSPESLSVSKTCQAKQLAEMEIDASPPLLLPEPENPHQATRSAGIRDNASPLSLPERLTRKSTRLAGSKISSPPPSWLDTTTSRQPTTRQVHLAKSMKNGGERNTKKGDKSTDMDDKRNHNQESSVISHPSLLDTTISDQPTARQVHLAISIKNEGERKTKKGDKNTDMDDKRNHNQESSVISHPSRLETTTSRQPTARRVHLAKSVKNGGERNPKKGDKNTDMDDKRNHNQESSVISHPIIQETHKKQESHTVLPPATSQEQYKAVKTEHSVLPPVSQTTPEVQPPPTVTVPRVNLEKQKSVVVGPPVCNPIPQNADSSINFSLNDLWTDPCIEFAVKTLTGAIPFNDLKKIDNFTASPPVQAPLHDIWRDPCIEFAVKTLTGAIPVAENNYLQFRHQPVPPASSSSNPRALHDFNLPDVGMNFCQTDIYSKQPESTVHTVGNGGLQKSGNVVNGSSGQCSRSRFFQ